MIKWLSKQWWAPVNSYGPCVGLTLWKWDRLKVELWYAPADFSPPEHIHENSDGEFTILYSKNRTIYRKASALIPDGLSGWEVIKVDPSKFDSLTRKCLTVGRNDCYVATTPSVWGKWLSVRAGTPHSFEKGDSCMIWIVVERWKPGVKVTSVSEDFKLT